MMAVVLRHIYKDVLCGGIKGVSKWYILKNVLMWFVVIESISIFSSLLINTYYAGAIKSRNEIEVEGMLLKQGIVACATLVVAICLCPIVEEIIYRVIIQKMLDEKTKTHDMVKGYAPKGGLTIGLQGIFTAKQIIMLVCGERKEEAYQAFMSQRISTSTPASLLWLHPNCVTLVDDTIQK